MFSGRISQQNPRNVECSSAKYFVVESQRCRMFISRIFCSRIPEMQNFQWQNISQQNPRDVECSTAVYFAVEFQKCRMFIGYIFRSRKFQKTKCKSFSRLFTEESVEFQKCKMLICRMFHSRKFQKPKCRYLSRLFTAEYSVVE